MIDKEKFIRLLDLFMHEYGWSFSEAESFISNTPFTIVTDLASRAQTRIHETLKFQAFYIGVGTAAVLSGDSKHLKALVFEQEEDKAIDEVTPEQAKSRMLNMWLAMGRKREDFDKAFESGKLEF